MIAIKTGVAYTQAYGCWFCLHVGSVVVYFGSGLKRYGTRLELFTPYHWFRWVWGGVGRDPATWNVSPIPQVVGGEAKNLVPVEEETPLTPSRLYGQVHTIVRLLLSIPDSVRKSELASLKESDQVLHILVCEEIKRLRFRQGD